MRKPLEATSLAALIFLWLLTIEALYGPNHLPSRIPTHFNLAGNPDAWGSPNGLSLLPAIATIVYLVLSLISRYPASFNYPARITAQNRNRLHALALQMIAAIKAETALLFAILQYAILHAFRPAFQSAHFALPPAIVPAGVGIILLTTFGHIFAMRRSA